MGFLSFSLKSPAWDKIYNFQLFLIFLFKYTISHLLGTVNSNPLEAVHIQWGSFQKATSWKKSKPETFSDTCKETFPTNKKQPAQETRASCFDVT